MKLTDGQQQALEAIRKVKVTHPEGGGIVVIAGYAGTGKSTALKVLAEQDEDMFVLTPTGKAALRVKEAAGCDALTIHRWMFKAEDDKNTGDVKFVLKEIGEVRYPQNGLLIVDEASMVTFGIFKDLYKYAKTLGLNLVFIGDGFQLPPVETNPEFQSFSIFSPEFPANHKVNMTEVVRQALDSPIIRASMAIRTEEFYLSELDQLPQIQSENLLEEARETWENGGTVICHKNVTRNEINLGVRKSLDFGDKIELNEPILILQNNYEVDVYNGEVLDVLSEPQIVNINPCIVTDRFKNASMYMDFLKFEIRTPYGIKKAVFADKEIRGENGEVRSYAIKQCGRTLVRNCEDYKYPVIHANFGYALTCHKAQGSEFNSVLGIIEPSAKIHTFEGRRWFYTLVTRAKKKIKICWR